MIIITRKEKILKIQQCIINNHYPIKPPINFYTGNCFAYAIGSTFKDEDDDYIYNLGNISHIIYPPKTLEEAKKAFKLDMETLGIDCRESTYEEHLQEEEWKVALFYDDFFIDSYDFHVMCQNEDSSWSHVECINGPLKCFENFNPEYYNTDLSFVSFFILKVNREKILKRI